MRVEIRSRAVALEAEMKESIRRRIGFVLGRYADRIRTVHVRIEDENGPKGGVDILCRVTVRGDGIGELHVEDRDRDPRVLIDRAIQRAGRSVARVVDRGRIVSPIPAREAFAEERKEEE